MKRRLLLLGGGHAHVQVLLGLADFISKNLDVTLVTPEPRHIYSGMVPGVVAGHYALPQAQIDLARLAAKAGVELTLDRVLSFDSQKVELEKGAALEFDLLSLNPGSLPDFHDVPGAMQHAIPAKPFSGFLERWQSLSKESRAPRIAIAGAGAGGVELAMAMKHRLAAAGVVLFSDRNSFSPAVAGRVARSLQRLSVDFRADTQVTAVEPGPLVVSRAGREQFDALFWVAGAAAPPMLQESGIACDARGYLRVDETLRSISHPAVFAAGDAASIEGADLPKSGVYSVRQGAMLAENLKRALVGANLMRYLPQKKNLALISCGGKYAIASRGGWSAEGAWAWRWKDWIDRRWVARFS